MFLLMTYVVLVCLGAGGAAGLGLAIEWEWGSVAGLWGFLAAYFGALWIGWVIAVRLTGPKTVEGRGV